MPKDLLITLTTQLKSLTNYLYSRLERLAYFINKRAL